MKLNLLEEKQGKIIPAYDPNLEHVYDSSLCPQDPSGSIQRDAPDSDETETDDSGVSLPDRIAIYGDRNVSIPCAQSASY